MLQTFIKHQRKTAGAMLAFLLLFVLAIGGTTCLMSASGDMPAASHHAAMGHGGCCNQPVEPAREDACMQHCAASVDMPVLNADMAVQAMVAMPPGKTVEVVSVLPPTPYIRPADTGSRLDRHPEEHRVLTI